MSDQLPLAIGFREQRSFSNFVPGTNHEVLDALRSSASGHGDWLLYLWGEPGVGKSHLLQAACCHAAHFERRAVYLPMAQMPQVPAELLSALDRLDLVCIDDVHRSGESAAWERALLRLYNRLRDTDRTLLVSANTPPAGLPIVLPDLHSRLGGGPVYQLRPLDDEAKLVALQDRARARGLSLSEEAARYLVRRARRDMDSLLEFLDRLDRASLAAQRKLTIPFIRNMLDGTIR
jgi:DnaA family protein